MAGLSCILVLSLYAVHLSTAENDNVQLHNLGELTSDEYSLSVMLDVPGKIIWKDSDNSDTLIKVIKNRISADNPVEVQVNVDKQGKMITVTTYSKDTNGSKSTLFQGEWYMLVSGLLYLWFHTWSSGNDKTMRMLVGLCVLGVVCITVHAASSDIHVEVIVQTPRHHVMKAAKLQTVGAGYIKVIPDKVTSTGELQCLNGPSSCDSCCYGNGICVEAGCKCDDGFSQSDCEYIQ